jgi:predicted DCC family thiol-disulfide oxidoreductase YuxK
MTKEPEMTDHKQPLTVYYDGACPSCVKDREKYERLAADDAQVHWCDITGKDEELRELGIEPQRALRELHVRDASGQIHSELDAYQLLVARAPRLRPLGWLIGLPLVKPVLSGLYRQMVDRRLRRTGRG